MKLFLVAITCLLLSFSSQSCILRMGIETSFAPYILQKNREDSDNKASTKHRQLEWFECGATRPAGKGSGLYSGVYS